MATQTSLPIAFEQGKAVQPSPAAVAGDHSLLELDHELDALLDQIQDEIDENGEATAEAMKRLQLFCQAIDVKIDRIGRFLSIMETRAEHCKKEAARYAARARQAQSKIDRTQMMVLYYLASHDLKKVESQEFTLRRQRNSQDTVKIAQPDAVPEFLRRFESKVEGLVWLQVIAALPPELAANLSSCVKSKEPSTTAIKEHIARGASVEGVSVKREYHLRVE